MCLKATCQDQIVLWDRGKHAVLKTACEGHECDGQKNRKTFVLITSCVLLAMSGMDKDIPNMCFKYSFRRARWLTFLAWLEGPSAKLSIDASGSCGSL